MRVAILLCSGLLALAAAREGPFKVYRVVPSTNRQLLKMIQMFETATSEEADFWHAPSTLNSTIDIMVGPKHTESFERFLEEDDYIYHVAIKDLKKCVLEKEGRIGEL